MFQYVYIILDWWGNMQQFRIHYNILTYHVKQESCEWAVATHYSITKYGSLGMVAKEKNMATSGCEHISVPWLYHNYIIAVPQRCQIIHHQNLQSSPKLLGHFSWVCLYESPLPFFNVESPSIAHSRLVDIQQYLMGRGV